MPKRGTAALTVKDHWVRLYEGSNCVYFMASNWVC